MQCLKRTTWPALFELQVRQADCIKFGGRVQAYTKEVVALLKEDSGGGSQVVVFQWGLQVVCDSQIMASLDQEVVVES